MVDTELLLEDFKIEAGVHIEKIETAFLNAETLSGDPKLINRVFRAAHSLKGTAGFFSLTKIVAVAHELESVFSRMKDGNLTVTDEVTDIVLQSIDCLKDLVNNIRADDAIEMDNLIEALKHFSETEKAEKEMKELGIPFDFSDPETADTLKKAIRFGQKIFHVNIAFNRSLGKYYKHPEGMISNILSIGSIIEAVVDGAVDKVIKNTDAAALTTQIINALAERDTSTLVLLVTSVLEPDLFSIATEIDAKYIAHLPKETVLSMGDIENQGGYKKPEKPVEHKKEEATKIHIESHEKRHEKTKPPSGMRSERVYEQAPTTREKNFSVWLDISAVNSLMDSANEMILTRNRLLSSLSGYKKEIDGLSPILHDLNRLTSEIQEKVMFTRMQPLKLIFGKFPRIMRDTAKALNKDIQIEILGQDVTLDKYLLDSLSDPITQLVKNAADHGIEPAEIRAALGKPLKGTITLNAYMRDGSAIIEVTDDGGGIDVETLKRKSLEHGIATEEMLAAMNEESIYNLMFEPGISTAPKITSLSGRGVGMDIVKTNVEKLGGSIAIASELNKGTTIRLKMPLTLSVVRTLVVSVDAVRYAVPETNVERIVRCSDRLASRRLEKINKSLFLNLDGWIIPVVTMKEIEEKVFQWKSVERSENAPFSAEGILEQFRLKGVAKCLVLKANGKHFALLVDDAVEIVETLVKPLPMYLHHYRCYSGVTILGDGNAIALLDAEGIMRLMGIGSVRKKVSAGEVKKDKKQIIIFKCSGTECYAIETSEISRIETVNPEYIQEIGSDCFINIAGKTVHMVRPEDFAPVKKKDYTAQKLYMLILKKSPSPTGFLAGKVLDKVEDEFLLSKDYLHSDFILGTSAYNEKILVFLNPDAIIKEVEKDKQRKKTAKKEEATVNKNIDNNI